MWLEYLLLRDGSVELLCSPTLMKNKKHQRMLFSCFEKKKDDCSRETEEAVSIVKTVKSGSTIQFTVP